jgi:hypothetical protein
MRQRIPDRDVKAREVTARATRHKATTRTID